MATHLPMKIHILESPSEEDVTLDRLEGNALRASLKLTGIGYSYTLVKTSDEFQASVRQLAQSYVKEFDHVPVLHISAHGSRDGLGFTSGDVIDWEALEKCIVPLNHICSDLLVLCMSSCMGFAADGMAYRGGAPPYFAIVGHPASPLLQDFTVAFCAFYHLLVIKGHDLSEAVEGMKSASGESGFRVSFAEERQKKWRVDLENSEMFRRVLQAGKEA